MIPPIALPVAILPTLQPAPAVEGAVPFEAVFNTEMASAQAAPRPLVPEPSLEKAGATQTPKAGEEDMTLPDAAVMEQPGMLPILLPNWQPPAPPASPLIVTENPATTGVEALPALTQAAVKSSETPPAQSKPNAMAADQIPAVFPALLKAQPLAQPAQAEIKIADASIPPEQEQVAAVLTKAMPAKVERKETTPVIRLAKVPPSPNQTLDVAVTEPVEALLLLPVTPIAGQPLPLASSSMAAPPPVDITIRPELDMTAPDRWLTELVDEVARFEGREGRMLFRLAPEHLGILEVSLTRAEDALSVEFGASNSETQAIMASGLPRLEQELRQKLPVRIETQLGAQSGQSERQPQASRPGWSLPEGTLHRSADTEDTETNRPAGLFA